MLDFIADFANWDNSTVREYLDTAARLPRRRTRRSAARPAPARWSWTRFAAAAPFRSKPCAWARTFLPVTSIPIPVLLNKVVLEYIPKYGQRLADEVRKWGEWIKHEAEKELAEFYPKDADGATPIAYLWARTIHCEGPGCGAEVPLIRSLWLAKKLHRTVGLQLVPNKKAKRVDFQIIVKQRDGWVDQANLKTKIENPKFDGTVKRGSATCPCCGYTTPVARVREQLKARHGGANDARLMCIVTTSVSEQGRSYRKPTDEDLKHVREATAKLGQRKQSHKGPVALVPDERLDIRGIRHTWGMIYGMESWGDFFTSRQLLTLTTILRLVQDAADGRAPRQTEQTSVQHCKHVSFSQ